MLQKKCRNRMKFTNSKQSLCFWIIFLKLYKYPQIYCLDIILKHYKYFLSISADILPRYNIASRSRGASGFCGEPKLST